MNISENMNISEKLSILESMKAGFERNAYYDELNVKMKSCTTNTQKIAVIDAEINNLKA